MALSSATQNNMDALRSSVQSRIKNGQGDPEALSEAIAGLADATHNVSIFNTGEAEQKGAELRALLTPEEQKHFDALQGNKMELLSNKDQVAGQLRSFSAQISPTGKAPEVAPSNTQIAGTNNADMGKMADQLKQMSPQMMQMAEGMIGGQIAQMFGPQAGQMAMHALDGMLKNMGGQAQAAGQTRVADSSAPEAQKSAPNSERAESSPAKVAVASGSPAITTSSGKSLDQPSNKIVHLNDPGFDYHGPVPRDVEPGYAEWESKNSKPGRDAEPNFNPPSNGVPVEEWRVANSPAPATQKFGKFVDQSSNKSFHFVGDPGMNYTGPKSPTENMDPGIAWIPSGPLNKQNNLPLISEVKVSTAEKDITMNAVDKDIAKKSLTPNKLQEPGQLGSNSKTAELDIDKLPKDMRAALAQAKDAGHIDKWKNTMAQTDGKDVGSRGHMDRNQAAEVGLKQISSGVVRIT